MTDLEKFVALYESVGIVLIPAHKPLRPPGWGSTECPGLQSLHLQEGTHPRIIGYSGFGTEIVFDAAGKFLRQEIWE